MTRRCLGILAALPFLFLLPRVASPRQDEETARWKIHGGFSRTGEYWSLQFGTKLEGLKDPITRLCPLLSRPPTILAGLVPTYLSFSDRHLHLVFPFRLTTPGSPREERGGVRLLPCRPEWLPPFIDGVQFDFQIGIGSPDVICVLRGGDPARWARIWSWSQDP